MMDVPKQLISEGIQDIIAGPTYGFGLSNTGKIYSWGYTRVSDAIDMKDIPAELTDGSVDIAFLAAGSDHAVAPAGIVINSVARLQDLHMVFHSGFQLAGNDKIKLLAGMG